MFRVGILGAGSLGTILGAYLIRGGCQVEYIDSYAAHVDALNRNGATVTGSVSFTVPARAVLPDEMSGVYDVVFVLVKQTANQTALPALLPHLGPDSLVVTLQNGMPDDEVGAIVGRDRLLGAPVGWGASFVGPGVSRLTSDPNCMHFSVGRPSGVVDDGVCLVQRLLSLMCPTEATENLLGIRWTKLMMNATFSGLSSVLGCTFGDVLDSTPAMNVLTRLGRECIQVSRACGIRMEPMGGNDFESLLWYEDEAGRQRAIANYLYFWDSQRALRASMLQDLEKGRLCEVDYINGAVVRQGEQVGVDAPANRLITAQIHQIQSGTRSTGWANLPELTANLA
jgi:2-dehydropantoate 2-reductase